MSDLAAACCRSAPLALLLVISVPLLGRYLAHVYTSPRHLAVERAAYRVLRLDPDADQHWRSYLMSVLGFSLVGRARSSSASAACRSTCRSRSAWPALPSDGAWNTAVSFVTNTNWQWYSGEAAIGPPVPDVRPDRPELPLRSGRHGGRRGVRPRRSPAPRTTVASATSGPTWSAARVRVLLPIAFVAALLLIVMGVVQNLDAPHTITTLPAAARA